MDIQEVTLDPREIVRQIRTTQANNHDLWTIRLRAPDGVMFRTLLNCLRTVSGRPERIIEDPADLPSGDEVIILSQTAPLTDHDSLPVVTDLFVARKG